MSLTSFRQAVAVEIAGIVAITTIKNGRIDGPLERYDVVCSWPIRKEENEDDVNLEDILIAVRVLRAWDQQRQPEEPFNPATLEADAEAIQAGAFDTQATLGPWLWRPTEFAFDLDEQRLDIAVYATQRNLFAQI